MTSQRDTARSIAEALGVAVAALQPLAAGTASEVFHARLADGRQIVAKVGDPGGGLDLEGRMLKALAAASWPVPAVLHGSRELLLIDHVPNDGKAGIAAEREVADILAACHGVVQPAFGFEFDTAIAGLQQPNTRSERWLPFFAEQRLLCMAQQAQGRGRLPMATLRRVERLAGRLDRWLEEPAQASLIHGDLWGGNVLYRAGHLAALIDPACYWADAEIEIAFTTMFHSFGEAFYHRYAEQRPLAPGFFEARRDLYNLYPQLVHVALGYCGFVAEVERTLSRFGA